MPSRLQQLSRGGSIRGLVTHAISIPKKIHRPKMVSEYQSTPSYPDVDEGFFLHESYGKAMFRPTNWKPSLRQDLISYNSVNHKKILDSLHIGPTITANLR